MDGDHNKDAPLFLAIPRSTAMSRGMTELLFDWLPLKVSSEKQYVLGRSEDKVVAYSWLARNAIRACRWSKLCRTSGVSKFGNVLSGASGYKWKELKYHVLPEEK